MKQLKATRRELDLEQYKMRSAQEGDYSTFVDTSTLVFEDDQLMIAYLELESDPTEIVEVLKSIDYDTGSRTDGLVATTKTFGFHPRNTLRRDFCTAAALAYESPEQHQVICDYAYQAADYYQQVNPNLFAKHEGMTQEKLISDYKIKQSPFTSGIINKNNPLKYHFDSGNYRNVWSAMLVFKYYVSGGFLSVPEYGLGFELKHNSLFLFDGQALLHGVTPIRKHHPDAFRFSVVYYSMRELWNCLPIDDEIIRIRRLKTIREEKRRGQDQRTKADFKK